MSNDEYEDVSNDKTLTVEIRVNWEPVSKVSQYARIETGRDTYVLYVNSQTGVHRGAMFKNGNVIKSTTSLGLKTLKTMLETLVRADARL